MQNAPSVTYPVGRSRMARWIGTALLAAGAGVVLLFCLQVQGAPWQKVLLALSWSAALVAALAARRMPDVALAHWDGRAWALQGTDGGERLHAARAAVQLDLQWLVLAQLAGDSGTARWVWFERAAQPSRWLAVRRALHAQRSEDAGPGAGTAAAPGGRA